MNKPYISSGGLGDELPSVAADDREPRLVRPLIQDFLADLALLRGSGPGEQQWRFRSPVGPVEVAVF